MAINEFDGNLNIISALDDQPALSASQLKSKFDEAGNTIKTWINGTLIPFINGFATGASINAGAIGTAKLADNAVTTEKIKDGEVTKAKLASAVQASLGKADTAMQSIGSGTVTKAMLASAVQTSLGKADTAYQKPSGGIPASDLAALTTLKVTSTMYGSTLPSSGTTGQIFFKKV